MMSLFALALAPLLATLWTLPLLLIYLHTPGYMIHQVEEHTDDRFRTYVNSKIFGGREALTTFDIIWINCGMVWACNLIALYAAASGSLAYGLLAPYLMLVNGIAHIVGALRGGYNPGLATSFIIFLPLALVTLALIPATVLEHLLALSAAILLHAIIILVANRRLAAVSRA